MGGTRYKQSPGKEMYPELCHGGLSIGLGAPLHEGGFFLPWELLVTGAGASCLCSMWNYIESPGARGLSSASSGSKVR